MNHAIERCDLKKTFCTCAARPARKLSPGKRTRGELAGSLLFDRSLARLPAQAITDERVTRVSDLAPLGSILAGARANARRPFKTQLENDLRVTSAAKVAASASAKRRALTSEEPRLEQVVQAIYASTSMCPEPEREAS